MVFGVLIVSGNETDTVKKSYEIFWGNYPNSKLGQYRPLARFSRSKNEPLNLEINLNQLRIPSGATHRHLFLNFQT
jgi:hypothetical protein